MTSKWQCLDLTSTAQLQRLRAQLSSQEHFQVQQSKYQGSDGVVLATSVICVCQFVLPIEIYTWQLFVDNKHMCINMFDCKYIYD